MSTDKHDLSRRKKLLLNTGAGFLKQIITILCGFVLPRYLLVYYGSSVNGLITSITSYLSFISLMDMGVGAVVQANLYKPLAQKDKGQISRLVKSSERFFRRLAYIFIAYIAVLCFVFPSMVEGDFGVWYTVSLVIIISVSTLAQYLFGMTYQLLLSADQKSYIPLTLQFGTIALNTLLTIILMRAGASVHAVKLMTAAVFVMRPLGQMLYVRRHYDIDRKIGLEGEPIRQKWNGFSQHIAAVVSSNIDVVALTLFSTLGNVSVYSVYFNVTYGVEELVMTATTGLESLFGNMIAKNEKQKLMRTFSAVEWIMHAGVTLIFTIAAITIVPFVRVYTSGITDAEYIVPLFAVSIVLAYGMQCLRVPYFRMIKAAGHFKETQNGAYISTIINIALTVPLVIFFGLKGAAVGTFAAMLYHTCYFALYLRKNILDRPFWHFAKYMLTDAVTAGAAWWLTRGFEMSAVGYGAWCVLALKVTGVTFLVCAAVNFLVYRKEIAGLMEFFRHRRK